MQIPQELSDFVTTGKLPDRSQLYAKMPALVLPPVGKQEGVIAALLSGGGSADVIIGAGTTGVEGADAAAGESPDAALQ